MIKRIFAILCLFCLLCGLSAAETLTEEISLDSTVEPLPIDFTPGHVADEANYTENGYEDESLRVTVEQRKLDHALVNIAWVKIADPSQLRTWVTARGRTNKISALAAKANAVVAIGGEYYATDDAGYIVRMGEVQLNSKKKAYKTPIATRDLMLVDENADFHILLRQRNAKDQKTKINPDFADQLKALVTEHTPVNVFDFGPALIIDGAPTEEPASYSFNIDALEPRCMIGQTGPLEYVLVVVDGERNGKEGMNFKEMQALMVELGCVQAYNLDGGNSALMVFHGANYSDKSVAAERSVSDIIYFATAVDAGLDAAE